MNRCAKCDAASCMFGGEIRNRTNTKNKQTVIDMSTLCLSACVDNKYVRSRNTGTEMHAGSVVYCSLVSQVEYTPKGQTDRQTVGRTPDRYITFTARRGQRTN